VAECYCCKKKGLILVFPKKGKPKAPGCSNQFDASPYTGLNTEGGQLEGENDDNSLESQEEPLP
jgi:hypothetical protein